MPPITTHHATLMPSITTHHATLISRIWQMNWLSIDPNEDDFGKALLGSMTPEMLKEFTVDPQVGSVWRSVWDPWDAACGIRRWIRVA